MKQERHNPADAAASQESTKKGFVIPAGTIDSNYDQQREALTELSKDLYPKAKEVFEAATGKGNFHDFASQIGLEDWIIFELDLFDRSHQKRLIDAWNIFETAGNFTQILMRHSQFEGLSREAFHNVGFELWQMYKSTPRSYEEFAQRTHSVEQEFSRLSEYRNTLEKDGDDIYESERELEEARSQTRSLVRKSLDRILMYIPGFSREAVRRIVRDQERKWDVTDSKEKLGRQDEAVFEEPILKYAHEVDVEILFAEFPTRVLEEIKAHHKEDKRQG